MSKFTEQLRALNIHNEYEFAGKGNVLIYYSPEDRGRGGCCAGWVVARPGYQTDPSAPWYDYGNKTFNVWGRGAKATKLDDAKAWASQKYGIAEWAKTPFGGWMDAAYVKRRVAELKARLKTVAEELTK